MDELPQGQQRGDGHPPQVETLMRQLKSQRLIKIFVGRSTEPYLMSETTLTEASPYFANALKHESSLGGTEPGVLHFPEDGDYAAAWEILLYWVMTRRLPPGLTFQDKDKPKRAVDESWTRTWVLADKYLLPELQDAVMLEMLRYFDDYRLATKESEVQMVNSMLQISPVDSPLRRLVAEEVIALIYPPYSRGLLKAEHVDSSGTALGTQASLLEACSDFWIGGQDFVRNGNSDDECRPLAWKEYLVGPAPTKHWIFDFMPNINSK